MALWLSENTASFLEDPEALTIQVCLLELIAVVHVSSSSKVHSHNYVKIPIPAERAFQVQALVIIFGNILIIMPD